MKKFKNHSHHLFRSIEGVEKLAALDQRDYPNLHWNEWERILKRTKKNTRKIYNQGPQIINLIFEDVLDGFEKIDESHKSMIEKRLLWDKLGKRFERRTERDPYLGLGEDEGYFITLRDTAYLELEI